MTAEQQMQVDEPTPFNAPDSVPSRAPVSATTSYPARVYAFFHEVDETCFPVDPSDSISELQKLRRLKLDQKVAAGSLLFERPTSDGLHSAADLLELTSKLRRYIVKLDEDLRTIVTILNDVFKADEPGFPSYSRASSDLYKKLAVLKGFPSVKMKADRFWKALTRHATVNGLLTEDERIAHFYHAIQSDDKLKCFPGRSKTS